MLNVVILFYTRKVGSVEFLKRSLFKYGWNVEIVRRIPANDYIVIVGDMNGHWGSDRTENERIHGGYGFEDRNEIGDRRSIK